MDDWPNLRAYSIMETVCDMGDPMYSMIHRWWATIADSTIETVLFPDRIYFGTWERSSAFPYYFLPSSNW